MTWLHDFLANQATAQSAGNGEVYPPIRTGPAAAIRATSPASPYARDRVEAPSNRPAARTPTLRSRAQDVIRSAPGALTAARERQVYDTTWSDVGRGAQELTGLPSLARGAGGLTAMAQLGMRGELGSEHIAPGAMAAGETALGLLGPMSLPRSAARTARATPLPQQYSSADTFESGPFSALYFNASPSRINLLEMGTDSAARGQGHARRGMQEFLRSHGNRDIYLTPSPTEPPYDVARLEGFYRSLGFGPVPGDADTFAWRRLGQPTTAQRIPRIAREIGPNGMPVAQSQPYRNSLRGGSADLREATPRPRTPPPTTPTGTAPFGDPRAYPQQAWDDFGSLQGGTPEARIPIGDLVRSEQGDAIVSSTFGRDRRAIRPRSGDAPIKVTMTPDGPYVLDGYHRLNLAEANGASDVPVEWVPFDEADAAIANTYMYERGRGLLRMPTPQPLRGGTPEARLRAQEQGFDTGRVLYHGTDTSFDGFSNEAMRRNDSGFYGRGTYFTTEPGEASYYAETRPSWQSSPDPVEGANVVPAFARGRFFEVNDGGNMAEIVPRFLETLRGMKNVPPRARELSQMWDEAVRGVDVEQVTVQMDPQSRRANWGIPDDMIDADGGATVWRDASSPVARYYPTRESAVSALALNRLSRDGHRFPLGVDAAIQKSIGADEFTDFLRANGYDGVRAGDETVVFDPRNIRSIFAAFDPAKRDSSDLLAASAAAAPIPIAATALTQQQNTTGRPRGRPGFFGGR